MRRLAERMRQTGTVGLVPTMGALHEGHAELIRRCRRAVDGVVVSLFVNPIQFGPNEDFDRYPRDLAADRSLLVKLGTDVLFAPTREEMYPDGFATSVEVRGLADHLCGASRPGHFSGVATVVVKLLNIVRPDVAVFGKKDFQQLAVIRRMVADLEFDVRIIGVPVVRDREGLALSSRNAYLTPSQRRAAPAVHRALVEARRAVQLGERRVARIRRLVVDRIEKAGGQVDYVEVVEPRRLEPVRRLDGTAVLVVAAFYGQTRLIDNMVLQISPGTGRTLCS